MSSPAKKQIKAGKPVKDAVSDAASVEPPSRENIAECAYFLWLERGKPAEQDLGIWCEAEAQVRRGPGSADTTT